jgi:hypothetical protein
VDGAVCFELLWALKGNKVAPRLDDTRRFLVQSTLTSLPRFLNLGSFVHNPVPYGSERN